MTPARSRRITAIRITDVECADDIALSRNSVKDAETALERVAGTVGLGMNEERTKYLVHLIDTPDCLQSSYPS